MRHNSYMNTHLWQSELAVGACRAGRLLAFAALAYALLALAVLAFSASPLGVALLWSGVALTALPALYLGTRIEIDHSLFLRLARMPSDNPEPLADLDSALAELNLTVSAHSGRPLVVRVAGLLKLVRSLGGCVALQTTLSLLAVWLR